MTAQDNLVEFFSLDAADDVSNVSFECDASLDAWKRSPTPVSVGMSTTCPLSRNSFAVYR
jgi:hypothetical protein